MTTDTGTAANGAADANKAYRQALLLGRIALISAFLALLIPTNSEVIAALSIGYAAGAIAFGAGLVLIARNAAQ